VILEELMTVAAALFGVAALGGGVLAAMRLAGRALPPMWLALVHGVVAAAALVSLLATAFRGVVAAAGLAAAAGFVLAALGGFALFANHLRGKPLPIPLTLVHGLLAAVSYVALLAGLYLERE
jgi:hypothetical protein